MSQGELKVDFNLGSLSTRSFQSLIEALSLETLGVPSVFFPSGPDGGRDIVFEGKIRGYEEKRWEGYLVVQIKYKEKLEGGTKDAQWLASEVQKEIAQFSSAKSTRRMPDYFIICSNVSLSGADGNGSSGKKRTGGYTKVNDHLAQWKRNSSLKDFDIWPYDKVCRMLEANTDVRRTYSAWVTPGDVLSTLLNHFEKPSFSDCIRRSMKISLLKDQNIQLTDAGDVSDKALRTSQVFVDLPVSDELSSQYSYDHIPIDADDDAQNAFENSFHTESNPQNNGVVSRLVARARDKLNVGAIWEHSASRESRSRPNLIVLLGGPGQGKSTASKFLVQLFRSSIISRDKKFRSDANLELLVPEILDRAKAEGIAEPICRYPVHIVLPTYADHLFKAAKQEKKLSLLSWIANELDLDGNGKVDNSTLRRWLATVPWLIVLDGLDEVPPSGARAQVISEINQLLTEIADVDGDVLVVVTTRPQGFNFDLPSDQWEYWNLSDLPTNTALAYAKRLGEVRYPLNQDKRNSISSRIAYALKNEATAKIMISPLQVTIIYVIADSGGNIPRDRWNLFHRYYEILKLRELSKGGEIFDALSSNAQHVDRLHRWAGLILHTLSETTGGAGATLSIAHFTALLHGCLRAGEVSENEIHDRTQELVHLALNRLVLLASRQEEAISFDVRSLQEFMAADALTIGGDHTFSSRLRRISKGAHWLHVVQISASRCYAAGSHEHLRPAIIGLTDELDNITKADTIVLSGARLALDLFNDGIAIGSSAQRASYARHALQLLSTGDVADAAKLARLWEPATQDMMIQVLRGHIQSAMGPTSLAAWKLAFILSSEGHEAVTALIIECFPKSSDAAFLVASQFQNPLNNEDVYKLIRNSILEQDPVRIREIAAIDVYYTREHNYGTFGKHLQELAWHTRQRPETSFSLFGKKGGMELALVPLSYPSALNQFLQFSSNKHGWIILALGAKFLQNPTAKHLSEVLMEIYDKKLLHVAKSVIFSLPWPIVLVFDCVHDYTSLQVAASSARQKKFGDIADWESAEIRWSKNGISSHDLLAPVDALSGCNIGTHGVPLSSSVRLYSTGDNFLFENLINQALTQDSNSFRRQTLLKWATYLLSMLAGTGKNVPGHYLIKLIENYDGEINTGMLIDIPDEAIFNDQALKIINEKAFNFKTESAIDVIALSRISENVNHFYNYPNILYLILLHAERDVNHLNSIPESVFYLSSKNSSELNGIISALIICTLRNIEKYTPSELSSALLSDNKLHALNAIIDVPLQYNEKILDVLCETINRLPRDNAIARNLREKLRGILNSRNSGLADSIVWQALALPQAAMDVLRRIQTPDHVSI